MIPNSNGERDRIEGRLLQLGGMVEWQLFNAIDVLRKGNVDQSEYFHKSGARIEALDRELTTFAFNILGVRQQNPEDLQAIFTTIKIAGYLKRVADCTQNIVRAAHVSAEIKIPDPMLKALTRMCEQLHSMLKLALDAYSQHDMSSVENMHANNIQLSQIQSCLCVGLLRLMDEDVGDMSRCVDVLRIAENIENMHGFALKIAQKVSDIAQQKNPESVQGGKSGVVPTLHDDVDDYKLEDRYTG